MDNLQDKLQEKFKDRFRLQCYIAACFCSGDRLSRAIETARAAEQRRHEAEALLLSPRTEFIDFALDNEDACKKIINDAFSKKESQNATGATPGIPPWENKNE